VEKSGKFSIHWALESKPDQVYPKTG